MVVRKRTLVNEDHISLEERLLAAERQAEKQRKEDLRKQMFDVNYDEEEDMMRFDTSAAAAAAPTKRSKTASSRVLGGDDDDEEEADLGSPLASRLGAGAIFDGLDDEAKLKPKNKKFANATRGAGDGDDEDAYDADGVRVRRAGAGDDDEDGDGEYDDEDGYEDDDAAEDGQRRVTGASTFSRFSFADQQRLSAMFGGDVEGLFGRQEESLAAAAASADADTVAAAAAAAAASTSVAPVLSGAARVRAERAKEAAAAARAVVEHDVPERLQARVALRASVAAALGIDARSFELGFALAPGVLDKLAAEDAEARGTDPERFDLSRAVPQPAPLLVDTVPTVPALLSPAEAASVAAGVSSAKTDVYMSAAREAVATAAGAGEVALLQHHRHAAADAAGFAQRVLARALAADPAGQELAQRMDPVVRELSLEAEAQWLWDTALQPSVGSAAAALGVGVTAAAKPGVAAAPRSELTRAAVAWLLGLLHRDRLDPGYVVAYKRDELCFPGLPAASLSDADVWTLDEADERWHALMLTRATTLKELVESR